MSGSPTIGNRELRELIEAGLVSRERCRSFLSDVRGTNSPKRLTRLCRKILGRPANERALRAYASKADSGIR